MDPVENTSATSYNPKHNPKFDKWKQIVMYKPDTKGSLYGNACVHRLLSKWKLTYHLITPQEMHSMHNMKMHNFFASLKMWGRGGIFWKKKLRKQIRKCRVQTGDYMG